MEGISQPSSNRLETRERGPDQVKRWPQTESQYTPWYEFVNPLWLKILAWLTAGIIAALNAYLLVLSIKGLGS